MQLEQFNDFLQQCTILINGCHDFQQLSQISTSLVDFGYFLIEKFEGTIYDLQFKILQQNQEIEDAQSQLETMNNQINEYYQQYKNQLIFSHDLEGKLCQQQQAMESKYNIDIQEQLKINRNLIDQIEEQKKQITTISQQKLILELRSKEIENKQIENQVQLGKWKSKYEQSQKLLTTQQLRNNKKHESYKSVEEHKDLEIDDVVWTFKNLVDENLFKKQEELYCCPSLEQIDDDDEIGNQNQNKSQLLFFYEDFKIKTQIFKDKSVACNPYKEFFKLITQCVKLNLRNQKYFEKDVNNLYQLFLDKNIPFNKWYDCIKKEIQK